MMKCAHNGCTCPEAKVVKNRQHYCSEYCAGKDGGKVETRPCGCGHATCH